MWRLLALLVAMIAVVVPSLGPRGIAAAAERVPLKIGSDAPAAAAAAAAPELQQAIALLQAGNQEGAIALLKELAKKHSEMSPAQVIVARWFAATNQPAQLRSALEEAVTEYPNDPEAYAILGELAFRKGEFTEAALLFRKVLDLAESQPGAGNDTAAVRLRNIRRAAQGGLAAVADTRKDWPAAQKHLEAVLADDPKNASALQQLGRALFHLKKPDEAFTRFQQSFAADKNLLNPEAMMANLYQQAGDTPSANDWMIKAITAYPRDYRTRLVAVEYSLKIGNMKQAVEQSEAAVSLAPDSFEVQMIRGSVALHFKDYPTAEKFLMQAHLQSPGNFQPTNSLAIALVEQKDEAKRRLAMEYAQFNARAFPDQAEVFATLGWVLFRLGRLDEAESALRKSASMGKLSPDAAYYMARYLLDRGQASEARRLFTQSLEPAIKSRTWFVMRQDAEALGEELKKGP